MSLFKDEAALSRYWKTKLEERHLKVYKNINLAGRKLDQHWFEWWGTNIPPPQPQIDLLFVDNQLRVFAIELKYFRKSEKGNRVINWSYYIGIDESLALLKFGFECVFLWHCFDCEVPKFIMSQYESTVSALIDNLKLPIEYRGFFLEKYEGEIYAYPIINGKPVIITSVDSGKRATPVTYTGFTKINPFKDDADAKRTLDFLRMVLKIPNI